GRAGDRRAPRRRPGLVGVDRARRTDRRHRRAGGAVAARVARHPTRRAGRQHDRGAPRPPGLPHPPRPDPPNRVVVRALAYYARAELRSRWRPWVGLALLLGVAGGIALGAA